MSTTQLTKLEAVNDMLEVISEAPIDNLVDIQLPDAELALNRLTAVSREVQQKGWWFNREGPIEFGLDVDGKVPLPANTMKVDTENGSEYINGVQRGSFLYNATDRTYVFTKAPCLSIVVLLDFEELPEAARQYIAARAARQFATSILGDAVRDRATEFDEQRAHDNFLAEDAEAGDYNMQDAPDLNWLTRGRA